MVELLSPAGDFECLKAAVQSGCHAVYFAAKSFGARAFASNFDEETLKQAIYYAKIRNVKTYLTLNTLIKESELEKALQLAKKAYQYGMDAIIVQDVGLGIELIKLFPNLPIHASTQMTVHNLEGVLALKELGFKRAILSRELSDEEIKYICQNTDTEIEVFIHGALCISYSGQCLFSSMIGGRSGNRGKCAQTCRLPYELLENITTLDPVTSNRTLHQLDKGYLLSTRDLCGLAYLPKLIEAGVTSFKIEGRMKSPEYVATVTRIYRKYIDLAQNPKSDFVIDPEDKLALRQVFNRGGFSSGHLDAKGNPNLVFPKKQNHMGIYLGTISKYNRNKGLVTCHLENDVSIGDSLSFERENTKYTISELMVQNQNSKTATISQTVTFGRMKGNLKPGDTIYKISDKNLSRIARESFSKENIKNQLVCKIKINEGQKIWVHIDCENFDANITYLYDFIPQSAQNGGLTKEKIMKQFQKTLDTEFEFSNFEIDLEDNLFLPVSVLNDIRRWGIEKIREEIIKGFQREPKNLSYFSSSISLTPANKTTPKLSLLLNHLHLDFDYTSLKTVDKLYIPLKYFGSPEYFSILTYFSNYFNLYIYMPTIIRKDYLSTCQKLLADAFENFKIKGIVISNLSQLKQIPPHTSLDMVGNYTLNLYNSYSCRVLEDLKIHTATISPELDVQGILSIGKNTSVSKELIVYGKIPVMTMNYCLLGKTNHCRKDCLQKCTSDATYFLKDRMGVLFQVVPDNTQTISTIYNSKITSITYQNFNVDFVRIDILDESIEEMNQIIKKVQSGKRFEGKDYTNGHLKRPV